MENLNKRIREYIKQNWHKTIRPAESLDCPLKIDYPFISPSVGGYFTDMYYWDTYFINMGLYLDGEEQQASYNVYNIAKFIEEWGFMPNATCVKDRTQPPVFCRMVYDYYQFTKDVGVLKRFVDTVIKEYNYFQTQRQTPIGLNAYGYCGTEDDLMLMYNRHHGRVQEESDDREVQLQLGKEITIIAEMGLDFNMRFRTKKNKVTASEFAHLDLNCMLYDVEVKLSQMLEILGRNDESLEFRKKAEERKQKINKYFYDEKTGIYWDYNFVDGSLSQVLTAVSLYPYTFGVSNDKEGALRVLKRIELEHGVSAAEYRGDDVYFQWDYPCLWPYTTYFSYVALKNVGAEDDAKRVIKAYNDAVETNFIKTGKIWEKYDAKTGEIGEGCEYETQEMLGWSAAMYIYFTEELKK